MSDTSKRPGAVIFVAIVLFVFGAYSVLTAGSMVGYAVTIALNPEVPDAKAKVRFDDVAASWRFVADQIPGRVATITTFGVVDVLFGVLDLACAIGLLRLAPAARKATINVISIGFLYALGRDLFFLFVVVPAQVRFYELHPPELPQGGPQEVKMFLTLLQIGVVVVASIGFLLQIFQVALVVWVLSTAKTKAAFAGAPPPTNEPPPLKAPSLYTGYEDDETAPASRAP